MGLQVTEGPNYSLSVLVEGDKNTAMALAADGGAFFLSLWVVVDVSLQHGGASVHGLLLLPLSVKRHLLQDPLG